MGHPPRSSAPIVTGRDHRPSLGRNRADLTCHERFTFRRPCQGADGSAHRVSLFLAGAVEFLGIITAEALYPGYSTRQDISDLESTLPPDPIIQQPSATIFNATAIATGLPLLVDTDVPHRAWDRRDVTIPLDIFGAAALGVGIFPGNLMPWHGRAAVIALFSGAFTVLLSARAVTRPSSWISLAFGGISLVVLLSAIGLNVTMNPLLVLGSRGVERWVVYPVLLGPLGFGGYLLGAGTAKQRHTS